MTSRRPLSRLFIISLSVFLTSAPFFSHLPVGLRDRLPRIASPPRNNFQLGHLFCQHIFPVASFPPRTSVLQRIRFWPEILCMFCWFYAFSEGRLSVLSDLVYQLLSPRQVYVTRVLPPNIYPGSDQQIRNDASHCRSHSSSIFAITRQ